MKLLLVAGARPNFMKIAPLYQTITNCSNKIKPIFVHTGQHYDNNMSQSFIENLGLPNPDYFLGVGSGLHGEQTAKIMIAFEKVVMQEKPGWVVVVGDVNSTIACALVASKLHVPVAHIEAGLRSYDREMPEEINRVLTDQISDLLFTTCAEAETNLIKEGVAKDKIHLVGNLMIESLIKHEQEILASNILDSIGIAKESYALITLHRPSNVDDPESLRGILQSLTEVSQHIPLVFPAHPRTQNRIREFHLLNDDNHQIKITDPIGYFDFLALQKNAKFILTDSGGIQEESAHFHVPCLTIRENTERPITITEGSNLLIGTDPERIIRESLNILEGNVKKGGSIPFWDDGVSKRVLKIFESYV